MRRWTATPTCWVCWSSRQPQHEGNPKGALRRLVFGPGGTGHVIYLVLENQCEVHVILVQWLG